MIEVELSDVARDRIAAIGFDPVFGARPLKRVIQREITNKLAEEVLSGWIEPGETIRIDVDSKSNGFTFETVAAPTDEKADKAKKVKKPEGKEKAKPKAQA